MTLAGWLSRLLAGFAGWRHPLPQSDEQAARERLYPPSQNVEAHTPEVWGLRNIIRSDRPLSIVTPPGHRRLPQ